MAFEFHLPDIGEGLAEATIVAWRVPIGGAVGLDEPVVEIETDKAVVEIPAPRAGVVLHHGAAEGETIEVESLLVVIGEEGESWTPSRSTTSTEAAQSPGGDAKPIVGDLEESEGVATRSTARPQALPLVRRLAVSRGVDLAGLRGSGPAGRITRSDVEAAAGDSGPIEKVRMSPIRAAIARNLSRSWEEIPHVTTFGSADPAALLAARRAGDVPLPIEALVIGAVVPILREFPAFNAFVDDDHIVYRKHYDIGFAVDTPDGLMVAVVREADRKDADGIGADIVRLATAARDRSIRPGDLRGATFTVSNIGAVGGGYGTPIIPYGTTAILSLGRAEEKPVVRDGEVVVGSELPLSLSYDHRAIDGASGRAFLARTIESLESL